MAVRLSALRAGRPLPPGRFLVLISVRGWVGPRTIVRPEELGQLRNPMTSSGIEARDLPACSIVPQPTTLPRAPYKMERAWGNYEYIFWVWKPQEMRPHGRRRRGWEQLIRPSVLGFSYRGHTASKRLIGNNFEVGNVGRFEGRPCSPGIPLDMLRMDG
jgi:hypothetical protein